MTTTSVSDSHAKATRRQIPEARNTTFMTWNLMHLARMLRTAGGVPAHGNVRAGWDAGCRYDFANPEYR